MDLMGNHALNVWMGGDSYNASGIKRDGYKINML